MPVISQRKTITLALLMGSCMSAPITAAYAQQDTAAGRTTRGLDEIVVTAQKRSESALDVPISIAAYSGETLEERTLRNLEDISLVTPGLTLDQSGGFGGQTVSIRGIAPTAGAATTGFYLDETPLQQPTTIFSPAVVPVVFDLDRVEILRGPQGTLYGAGSMGGTVRFIQTQPDLTEASATLNAEVAKTDDGGVTPQFSIYGGAPLVNDRVAFRAGFYYRDEAGWIDRHDRDTGAVVEDDVNDTQTIAARLALLFQVSDEFSISPSVFYQKTEADDMDLYWADAGLNNTFTDRAQPEDDEYLVANLTADYDFGAFSVKSVSSFINRDFSQINDWTDSDGASLPFILGGIRSEVFMVPFEPAVLTDDFVGHMYWSTDQKAYSQEIRFFSNDTGDSKLSWIAGFYYQRSEYERIRHEYQDINAESINTLGFPIDDIVFQGPLSDELGLPVSYFDTVDNVESEVAGFANLTYNFTEQLSASAGVRISRTKFQASQVQNGFWVGGETSAIGTQSETPISPKFNINYEPSENHTLYASAAKGFRIGGTNPDYSVSTTCAPDLPGGSNPTEFNSDQLWSYEVGSKNRLAEGRVNLNVSGFHIDWKDIQGAITLPTCLNVYTDNLGDAKVDGFDVELGVQLTDSFTASITAGYADGRYSETVMDDYGQTLVQKDQELGVPKLNGSATLFYDGQIAGVDTFGNISVSHAGKYERTGPDGVVGADAEIRDAEAVTQLSGRLGVRLGAVSLSLFAENLTNETPELGKTRVFGGSPILLIRTLRPRTIGAALKYDFN
ncbi:MAG: hypothetical protein CMI63_21445 [Parvularcula sp.]|nr:hypothetical protein [Parvularcula sp.]